ncbi:MAG: 4Fe-4S binding protein [Phocaeicola sp.]
MIKNIRVVLALFFLVAITLLFLDFTGTIHGWLGWMAKIQFLPALLALHAAIVIGLIVMTLLLGRFYCSVICPLGLFQDVVSRLNRKRNKFGYSSPLSWLRYGVLALFLAAFVAGIGSFVALLEPYSAYGRMASTLGGPLYAWGNNLLAYLAERADSYAFYETEVWMRGLGTLTIAVVTLLVISTLAYRNGRTYCNTICPVGTILGFVARFSIYKVRFDVQKCNRCGLCARGCKASCIDSKSQTVDASRCVSCYNCLGVCKKDALHYKAGSPWTGSCTEVKTTHSQDEAVIDTATRSTQPTALSNDSVTHRVSVEQVNSARRNMLAVTGSLLAASALKAQQAKVDGGLAYIEDKKIPKREIPLVPPGSQTLRNFNKRCTACQLCVSVCPNQILRPSTSLTSFMQPEMSYERGYCRPECTKCSEVCPAGAIQRMTVADKAATQIGRAIFVEKNCVTLTDGVTCGNCARHCPVGAITMIEVDPDGLDSPKIPLVDTERCIGCGACEYQCPARPFSAIYVEGNRAHRVV